MVFLAFKTFDLVIKVASSYFGTRAKVFKALLNFRSSAKNYKKF